MPPEPEFEIDALDNFLSSDAAPEDCMQISDLDGFLTAVAIGSELIKPSEWLPVIWRGGAPSFKSADEAELVTSQIFARYNHILHTSPLGSEYIEPWFWETPDGAVIAMDWCEGFFEGVGLRMEAWTSLLEDPHGKMIFAPIAAHLSDSSGELMTKGSPDEVSSALDRAAAMIPSAVFEIRKFWENAVKV